MAAFGGRTLEIKDYRIFAVRSTITSGIITKKRAREGVNHYNTRAIGLTTSKEEVGNGVGGPVRRKSLATAQLWLEGLTEGLTAEGGLLKGQNGAAVLLPTVPEREGRLRPVVPISEVFMVSINFPGSGRATERIISPAVKIKKRVYSSITKRTIN